MTKLRYRFRGQRSNASPFRSRVCGTSSPFQIHPGCGSTDHRSRITDHSVRVKQRDPESVRGFTLVELLVVVGIIALLLVLMAPAFTYIKGGTDVTSAAYTIKGVLDTARSYAKANNTYTWVGFYEEDVSRPSTNPATSGTGRLVMSIVASKDGTMLYTGVPTSSVTLDPSPPSPPTLLQVDKLAKVDNFHFIAFPNASGIPPPETFNTRPAAGSNSARIDNNNPPTPCFVFHYPVGSSSPQYTFAKVVQFSPRGEAVVGNTNYTLATVSEIGLQSTHGTVPEPSPVKNPVAIQFTGLGGTVKIYRR